MSIHLAHSVFLAVIRSYTHAYAYKYIIGKSLIDLHWWQNTECVAENAAPSHKTQIKRRIDKVLVPARPWSFGNSNECKCRWVCHSIKSSQKKASNGFSAMADVCYKLSMWFYNLFSNFVVSQLGNQHPNILSLALSSNSVEKLQHFFLSCTLYFCVDTMDLSGACTRARARMCVCQWILFQRFKQFRNNLFHLFHTRKNCLMCVRIVLNWVELDFNVYSGTHIHFYSFVCSLNLCQTKMLATKMPLAERVSANDGALEWRLNRNSNSKWFKQSKYKKIM